MSRFKIENIHDFVIFFGKVHKKTIFKKKGYAEDCCDLLIFAPQGTLSYTNTLYIIITQSSHMLEYRQPITYYVIISQ